MLLTAPVTIVSILPNPRLGKETNKLVLFASSFKPFLGIEKILRQSCDFSAKGIYIFLQVKETTRIDIYF